MMGKGAEGGCIGNGCSASTNIGLIRFSKGLCQSNVTNRMRRRAGQDRRGLDVFSQVLKALAIKPAHGEVGGAASNGSLSAPSSSENRRKHRVKRNDILGSLHRDNLESSWNRDPCGSPFWLHMEEYFREPTPDDIQLLLPKTKLAELTLCNSLDPLLQMPLASLFDKDILKQESSKEDANLLSVCEQHSVPLNVLFPENWRSPGDADEPMNSLNVHEQQQSMAGAKRKIVAASPVSNRRKLTASASEIVTAVISPPENGDEELCHACYRGDSDELNQILFCDSCNVAVHQGCYGIKVVPKGQWLCSFCNHRNNTNGEALPSQTPDCVLCPVKGGALKLVAAAAECSNKVAFGHLFCCQWIPETFIGDMVQMEPIMNVEGVGEERWKLLCSICKDKHGACIQCSHGMCATAFHPLCARRSKLRMEVSSNENGDELDFHAFCSKHTAQVCKLPANVGVQNEVTLDTNNFGDAIIESSSNKVGEKLKEATVRCEDRSIQAGDDGGGLVSNVGTVKNDMLLRGGVVMDGGFNSNMVNGNKTVAINAELLESETSSGLLRPKNSAGTVYNSATDIDARYLLKNIMEQTHATSNDIAVQMGISHNSLSTWLQGKDLPEQEVREKVKFWILGSLAIHGELPLLGGRNATKIISTDEREEISNFNGKDSLFKTYCNKRRKLEHLAFLSQRRLKEVLPPTNQIPVTDTGLLKNMDMQHHPCAETGRQSMQDVRSVPCNHYSEMDANFEEERQQPRLSWEITSEDATTQSVGQLCSSGIMHKDGEVDGEPVSVLSTVRSDDGTTFNSHPFILKRLMEVQNSIAERDSEAETGKLQDASLLSDTFLASASPCLEVQEKKIHRSNCYQSKKFVRKPNSAPKPSSNAINESFEAQVKQLEQAKKLGILDMAPQDELEGEILTLQTKLIARAERNCHQCEQLILKIIPNLSKDLRASWRKAKDLALVNHYSSVIRETKKQGRKERRSKEAQAVSAAATAVAAVSTRLGSLRRDAPGGHTNDEKTYFVRDTLCTPVVATSHFCGVSSSVARPDICKPISYGQTSSSHTSSCGKVGSFEQDRKVFDFRTYGSELSSGESRDQLTLCDICKDPSHSNAISICQRCKVAVHQHCYGVNGIPTSDWRCQPCSEIARQFQGLKVPEVAGRAAPGYGVVCGLCFGQSGAFKRCFDNHWAHVFCAQWVPETIAEKDEAGSSEASKLVTMERILQECSVCHTKQGARLRCSFGHCHGSFHPLCARDSGLYMSVKRSPGGRVQYRAYCEKHSSQQRQKAESKRCGSSDGLSVLLQMRAELERLRILCERVCKRERIKRDRLFCTIDLYMAHMSSMSSSAMASNDVSATSTNTLDTPFSFHKVFSQAMHNQRNDLVAAKPPEGLESESYSWSSVAGEGNKYQDSLSGDSVYQTQFSWSEPSRETPARSQVSDAAAVCVRGRLTPLAGAVANADQKRLRKHQKAETLHTEVVMTPTEASVQNQRLPKGYAYVPVGVLPKGKVNLYEASAVKDL